MTTPDPIPPGRLARRARTIAQGALRQGLTELRIQLFSWNVLSWLLFPTIGLVVLFFLRDSHVMDSTVSLAQLGFPGLLTLSLASSGFMGVAGQLITEREDGTLLRAKAVPDGMTSHLIGNMIMAIGTTIAPALGLVIASTVLLEGIAPRGLQGWLTLGWVCLLGMFAFLPFGAMLGALARGPMTMAWTSLVLYALLSISGVFYPLSALPGWLQVIGQALPLYWIGLGLRSAFLPPEAAALELGGAWQTGTVFVVLAAWAIIGITLAPIALRRMARRQSGSQVAAARERVMARGY